MNRLDYEFDSWWYKNQESVKKRNLHTFSGLYRTTLGEEYYRESWKFRQMLLKNAFNIKK